MADATAEILKLVQQMNKAKEQGQTEDEDRAVRLFIDLVTVLNKVYVCDRDRDHCNSDIVLSTLINLVGSFIGTHCATLKDLGQCTAESISAILDVSATFFKSRRTWPPKFI